LISPKHWKDFQQYLEEYRLVPLSLRANHPEQVEMLPEYRLLPSQPHLPLLYQQYHPTRFSLSIRATPDVARPARRSAQLMRARCIKPPRRGFSARHSAPGRPKSADDKKPLAVRWRSHRTARGQQAQRVRLRGSKGFPLWYGRLVTNGAAHL